MLMTKIKSIVRTPLTDISGFAHSIAFDEDFSVFKNGVVTFGASHLDTSNEFP